MGAGPTTLTVPGGPGAQELFCGFFDIYAPNNSGAYVFTAKWLDRYSCEGVKSSDSKYCPAPHPKGHFCLARPFLLNAKPLIQAQYVISCYTKDGAPLIVKKLGLLGDVEKDNAVVRALGSLCRNEHTCKRYLYPPVENPAPGAWSLGCNGSAVDYLNRPVPVYALRLPFEVK